MADGKWKDVTKRIETDKVLKDKAFKITSDPKYNSYQRGLASKFYKLFDKNSSGNGVANEPNYQLVNEVHKPIIKKFKKKKFIIIYRQYLGRWFSWYTIIEQMQQRNQIFIVCNW